jgi:uncharacterized protein YfbU (UPF0304 family)
VPYLKRIKKRRVPWLNPKRAQHYARLHRIVRKGFGKLDEAETERVIAEAIEQGRVKRIP